ncbi:proline dehydrogenase family protein [Candidatus Neomarinimicrobiota bacterium]
MLKLINYLIVALLPLVPKKIIGIFAKRYVAGETVPTALTATQELNDCGFAVTLDILGEHVKTTAEAKAIADRYVALYQQIADAGVQANISVKPTHLGLDLGLDVCRENLFAILDAAKAQNNFLRIDMENSPYTDRTIELYRSCQGRYPSVGMVLQAYLYRSARDITELSSAPFNFRLCKGIYRESPEIAIQERQAINSNFLDLTRQALTDGTYVGLATHDQGLIDDLVKLVQEIGTPTACFEFQVLYGVPMGTKLEELLKLGYKVRVYVPFGEEWYDYSIRRLKENPDIAGNVLRNLFRS